MADVEVKCEQCGAPVVLSEYAAINTISCRSCGSALKAVPTSPTDSVGERLKLKQREVADEPGEESDDANWSWLCFIVIAALMASIRFLYIMPPDYLDVLQLYGPYLALLMHVIIILMAFKDTVFQGILCLLIPGYSFFYLFLVSDNFWARALMGGLLVGIGLDSALFYKDVAGNVYRTVSDYIASGG
jgi:DNA-directed RNA polymerase subunit RPC12/RpoP